MEELDAFKSLTENDRKPIEVKWNPDGKAFAVLFNKMIQVYDLEM